MRCLKRPTLSQWGGDHLNDIKSPHRRNRVNKRYFHCLPSADPFGGLASGDVTELTSYVIKVHMDPVRLPAATQFRLAIYVLPWTTAFIIPIPYKYTTNGRTKPIDRGSTMSVL